MRKPSSPIIASHTVRPMWPRYGNLLEVVDGNWMLRGYRQNHKVSEETRSLDARHSCPPPMCGYALMSANLVPSYGSNILGQKRNHTNLFTKIDDLIFNKILGNKYIGIN